MELRQSEKELLKPFYEQRKTIIASYKNGNISKEEAKNTIEKSCFRSKAKTKFE